MKKRRRRRADSFSVADPTPPSKLGAPIQRRRSLASSYALKGNTERGIAELLEARRLSGCDFYHSIAHLRALADY